MITILTGKPGSGKSYNLARIAIENLQKGKNVFSNVKINVKNFKVKGQFYYYENLNQFKNVYDGIVIMDECQRYINSRRWQELNQEIELKFQAHRHHSIDIYGATQNLNRADKIIRELSHEVVIIKKFFNIFLLKYYEPEQYELKTKKSLKSEYYFFNKKIANTYDTKQLRNASKSDLSQFAKMSDFFDF